MHSLCRRIGRAPLAPPSLPPCPYGAACYRKNPKHFLEYSHPADHGGCGGVGKRKRELGDDGSDGGGGGGGGGSSTGAGSSTDAPLDVAPDAGARLASGTRVRLEGLVAMAELNGRRGVVLRFDESKQRHVVSIRRGDEAEEFAVRRENLVVRSS